MIYNRDIAHCDGARRKLRNECYRYWLHKNRPRHYVVSYILGQFDPTKGTCKYFYKFRTL